MALKVVRFRRGDAPTARAAWARVLGGEGARSRVTKVTWAVPVVEPGLPPAGFDAVEVVWFGEDATVAAHDAHLASLDPDLALGDGSVAVVVDEVVGRGADALAARWAEGGPRPKMMSVGRRAASLSRAAFAERWRAEAGTLGGERIPDEVRGVAYVQDHPVGDDPPLDAINEVWFASVDDLRARAAWLAARPVPVDLMDPATCATLCLREDVLTR